MMEQGEETIDTNLVLMFVYMLVAELVVYHCMIPCSATLLTLWTSDYFLLWYELELNSLLSVLFTVMLMVPALITVEQSRAWSNLFANNRTIICWRHWLTVVLSLVIVWCIGCTLVELVKDGSGSSESQKSVGAKGGSGSRSQQGLKHLDAFLLEWSMLASAVLKLMYFNGIFANWTAFDGMISVLRHSDNWNELDFDTWNDHSDNDNKSLVRAFENILYESL